MTEKRHQWASNLGFILAAAGSAVGLGNIWKFPGKVGAYGGGAFLIPYFLFVALFSYVGLSGEFALGRLTGTGAMGSLDYVLRQRGRRGGRVLGAIPLLGVLGIAIGYSVVVGWVLRYAAGSLTGSVLAGDAQGFFSALAVDFGSIPWHFAAVAVTAAILIFGVASGIEKLSKVMMPAFFILFLIIAVRVAFLPGAMEGYLYLLRPDWSYLLNPETWVMAMGQAFFTLSLGIGAMAIFGSYIGKERRLFGEAINVGVLDTCVAFVSGLIIFPSAFAFGVNPGQGPSLIFVTLPNVFNAMPGGQLWGALFFVFLFFAALSTVTAVFENILACWMDRFGISRGRAVLANLVLIFLLSLPCLLGNNLWSGVKALGMGIMDWEDFLVSNNLLPIGSMIYLLFCCVSKKYGWGYDHFLEEANQGRGVRFPAQFRLYFKYVLPVIVLIIFIMGYWDKFKPFIVAALGA